ncbi:hypothetical protein FH972_025722 [Carpinus fangiana]|uniref:Uncharacterized protein n=1 Tax=Carpinus fangiana TaxID=176857 RepID=A0A5N6L292_9ROSI|nr:hypothetical protein FH972_025722 [Carpinus fangiana]
MTFRISPRIHLHVPTPVPARHAQRTCTPSLLCSHEQHTAAGKLAHKPVPYNNGNGDGDCGKAVQREDGGKSSSAVSCRGGQCQGQGGLRGL